MGGGILEVAAVSGLLAKLSCRFGILITLLTLPPPNNYLLEKLLADSYLTSCLLLKSRILSLAGSTPSSSVLPLLSNGMMLFLLVSTALSCFYSSKVLNIIYYSECDYDKSLV